MLAQSMANQLAIERSRLPKSVKTMRMKEFCEKYQGDIGIVVETQRAEMERRMSVVQPRASVAGQRRQTRVAMSGDKPQIMVQMDGADIDLSDAKVYKTMKPHERQEVARYLQNTINQLVGVMQTAEQEYS